jgi:hypothetical protein
LIYSFENSANIENTVMASSILSLFNSLSMELFKGKDRVKFLDCTVGINSSDNQKVNNLKRSRENAANMIK